MAVTTGVTLSTSAYTAVTVVYGRVRLVMSPQNLGGARVIVSTTSPSADSDNWYPMKADQVLDIDTVYGDIVYAMADAPPNGGTDTKKMRVLVDDSRLTDIIYPKSVY